MNFYITQRWGRFYDRILSLKVSFYLRASKCSNSFLDFLQLCCFEMIISGKLGQTYTVLINVQFITFFTRLDKHFIFYIARSANFIICMLRYAYCFACLEKFEIIWNNKAFNLKFWNNFCLDSYYLLSKICVNRKVNLIRE